MMAGTLPHREALALATSCAELLRDAGADGISVRLSHSAENSSALLWLEISVSSASCSVAKPIGLVRGVVDVLRALAQCSGCAPQANAQLWEEILYTTGVELGPPRAVPIGFDPAFPRVRLCFESIECPADARRREAETVAIALQHFTRHNAETSEERLEAVKTRLAPFVSTSSRDPRVLELALALPSMDTTWLLPAVVKFTEDLKMVSAGDTVMEVVEISLDQRRFRSEDPLDGMRWLTDLSHVTSISHWTLDEEIDDPCVYVRLYRRLLGLEDGGVRIHVMKIHTLDVVLPNVSERQFAAICSALPFTSSVRRLQISKDSDWQWDVLSSETEWAWLGYALFHQHAATSTWRELTIDGCAFREQDVRALGVLQREGAVALARYIGAYNRGEAVIQPLVSIGRSGTSLCPSDSLVSASHPFLVLDKTTAFDAIGSPSGEFQGVVVPGAGFGYIRGENVTSTSTTDEFACDASFTGALPRRDASPRCARLTAFRANPVGSTSGTFDGLQSVVRALASSLMTVELETERPLTPGDVNELLSSCPKLTSIAFDHDGTCWTRWPVTREDVYPNLTSIRQTCSLIEACSTLISLNHLPHPAFPALRVLYFHVTKGCSAFPQFSPAIRVALNANTAIECLAMVKVRHSGAKRSRAAGSPREQRSRILSRLGLSPSYIDEPSQRATIEYEKAVRVAMQPLWMTLETPLPAEIVQKILAFTGGGRKRHLCVDLA